MGAKTGYILMRAKITFTIALLALAGGCGSHRDIGLAPSGAEELPWPPPAGISREASDAVVRIAGKDATATGGTANINGFGLELKHGSSLSWAVYTVSNLQGGLTIELAELDNIVTPKTTGDGTCIYVGISDYGVGHWHWEQVNPAITTYVRLLQNDPDYISEDGTTSLAVVLQGSGSALLSEVRFSVKGATTLPAPENLVAWADVGRITLDWDKVTVAAGYNVYRSTEPDFPGPVKINAALVTENTYADDTTVAGRMYYYRVSAVRIGESDLSNMVDIFSPQVDLALPGNPSVNERGDTWVRVQWSYGSVDPPNGWYLYLSEVANFSLNSPLTRSSELPFVRTSIFEELEAGRIYYWRVVGRAGANLGRMTDDRPLTVKGFWTWEETEVGAGSAPLDAITHDTTMDVVYLDSYGVKLAESTGGAFTTYDTPLVSSFETYGFTESVNVNYRNGQHLVTGHTFASDDLYGAIGNPGSWTEYRFSGDGDTSMKHPMGAFFIRSAVNDAGFALLETDCITAESKLLFFAWDGTKQSEYAFTPLYMPHYSIAYFDNKLTMLYWNSTAEGDRLLCYDSELGTTNIIADIGMYNDLQVVGGKLVTPAYSAAGALYTLTKNGDAWDGALVASGTDPVGLEAQLVPDGASGAFMIFRDDSPAQNWYIAAYDGTTWAVGVLLLPDVMLAGNMGLTCLDGSPWIFYSDLWRLGHVFAAKGIAPT